MITKFDYKPINICINYKFSKLISTVLLVTLVLTYIHEYNVQNSVSNKLHTMGLSRQSVREDPGAGVGLMARGVSVSRPELGIIPLARMSVIRPSTLVCTRLLTMSSTPPFLFHVDR